MNNVNKGFRLLSATVFAIGLFFLVVFPGFIGVVNIFLLRL